MHLDHIGIVVRNLVEAVARYRTLLGVATEPIPISEISAEGVRIAEFPLGDTTVELLEPLSDDSPISSFLQKRGEGLHHICYQVNDIHTIFAQLQAEGFHLLSPEVKLVRDYLYFFVHPRSAHGVLIEYKQLKEEGV